MMYRLTLSLDEAEKFLKVNTRHEYIDENTKEHHEAIFLSILISCKESDRKAFYNALTRFVNKDFDDAMKFIDEERHHES